MENDTITITKTEYKKLLQRDLKLHILEVDGVDNWEWYMESSDEPKYEEERKKIDAI